MPYLKDVTFPWGISDRGRYSPIYPLRTWVSLPFRSAGPAAKKSSTGRFFLTRLLFRVRLSSSVQRHKKRGTMVNRTPFFMSGEGGACWTTLTPQVDKVGEGGESRTHVRKHFRVIFSERSFWFSVSLLPTPKSRLRFRLSYSSSMLLGAHTEFSCIFDARSADLQVNRSWRAWLKPPVRSLFYF